MRDCILYLCHHDNSFTATTYRGFVRFAKERDWAVQRIDLPADLSHNRLRNLISFWNPQGIVYDCGGSRKSCPWIAKSNLPFILIDTDTSRFKDPSGHLTFINCDSTAIGNLAAKTLFQRGLRHFAAVTYHAKQYWSKARIAAFQSAVSLNGGTFSLFRETNLPVDDQNALRRLCAWISTLPRPCGLLAANDLTASFVLAAAKQSNVAVPDELNVIGIDDDETTCETTEPSLSSIRLDFVFGGFLAGQQLEASLRQRPDSCNHYLYGPVRFVERLSTRQLANPSSTIKKALEVIHSQAHSGLRAVDVLPILGGSRRSAEQRFRKATGKSILEEILDARFERLLRLLDDRNVRLGSLAGLVGFSSDNHLRRLFKARFGFSMSDYLSRQRQRLDSLALSSDA